MDLKDIKKLIELMKENDLSEFEMEDQGFRVAAKRGLGGGTHVYMPSAVPTVAMPTAQSLMPAMESAVTASQANAGAAKASAEEEKWVDIRSPIVGTFYRAASPDVEPFVSVGQVVDEDTVVCIVEAMKVMNEIKAEVRGVIKKVLVDNATPVEFGQCMFKVEPS